MWSPQNWLPQPLQLLFCHGVPLIVKDLSAWGFKTKTLVPGEVFRALKKLQDFVNPMSQQWNILPADAAIELNVLACCVRCPSQKKMAHFIGPPDFIHSVSPLGMDCSVRLITLRVLAASVSGFKHLGHNT